MATVAPRLGRLVKMIAVAGAMVANQASGEYLANQVEEVDPLGKN